MPFSRIETVDVITSHYKFLTTHLPHLEPSHLRLPPSTGWLGINSNSLSRLNKSAAVIDLLRHLPYISQQACNSSFAQNVKVIDFPFWVERQAQDYEKIEPLGYPVLEAALPPHAVVLTTGDKWASHYVLDTERGTITDWSMHHRPEESGTDNSLNHAMTGSESWMSHPTKPIAEFFHDLRQKFLDLEWVPRVGGNSEGIEEHWPGVKHVHLDYLADVYQVFGWPHLDRFDRDGCRAVIVEIEERIRDGYLRKSRFGDLSRKTKMSEEAEERFAWATCRVLEIREERRKAPFEATVETERDEVAASADFLPSDAKESEDEDDDQDENEQVEDDHIWVEVRDNDGFVEVESFESGRADIAKELGFAKQTPMVGSDASRNTQEIGWEVISSPFTKLGLLDR